MFGLQAETDPSVVMACFSRIVTTIGGPDYKTEVGTPTHGTLRSTSRQPLGNVADTALHINSGLIWFVAERERLWRRT
jgi:hypothetical protein